MSQRTQRYKNINPCKSVPKEVLPEAVDFIGNGNSGGNPKRLRVSLQGHKIIDQRYCF